MYCNFLEASLLPVKIKCRKLSLNDICTLAYNAVNDTMPNHRKYADAYKRKMFQKEWNKGPICLLSKVQMNSIALARGLAIYWMRIKGHTTQVIAKHFGYKDHTPVCYWEKKIHYILYKQKFESDEKNAAILFVNRCTRM